MLELHNATPDTTLPVQNCELHGKVVAEFEEHPTLSPSSPDSGSNVGQDL